MTDSGVLLGGMITLFVGSFVWLTWLTHARFGTFGFDAMKERGLRSL